MGGQETEVNEYPWQVGLVTSTGDYARIPFCGGSIISIRHILTAAHCTYDRAVSSTRVLLGEHDTSDDVADIRTISDINIHPQYNPSNLVNDISILTLTLTLTYSRTMSPICLPMTTNTWAGDVATATGWGRTSGGGPLSPTLQEVDITVLSNNDCRDAYPDALPIQE